MDSPDALRRASLVLQLRSMGITDHRIVSAFETTPRESFVPEAYANDAYGDRLIPIGCGQTLEAPSVLARLLARLAITDSMTVLEVGTGSAYFSALLGKLARRVVSVERYRSLVDEARAVLETQKVRNVEVVLGDGLNGWPAAAPYNAIIASGAVDTPPMQWFDQLAPAGVLIAPIGASPTAQTWVQFTRADDGSLQQDVLDRAFTIPLAPGLARTL